MIAAGELLPADPYVAYTRRFFDRWLPWYDLFARPIAFAYRAAVEAAGAGPGRRILDCCTGTGQIALRAADAGAAVVGVDLTPSMIAEASSKRRGRDVDLQLMDARRLGFGDGAFDAVILSFALHDMPRRVRLEVLAEVWRVTSQRLVILDYQFPDRRPWRSLAVAAVASYESAYLRDFAKEPLDGLVTAAGLPAPSVSPVIPGLMATAVVDRAAGRASSRATPRRGAPPSAGRRHRIRAGPSLGVV